MSAKPLPPNSLIVYVSFILSQLTLNFLSLCLPSTVVPLNGGIIALRLKSALCLEEFWLLLKNPFMVICCYLTLIWHL